MRAPVLGLFGGADPGIPASEIDELDRTLKDAGVKRHIVTYPGAPHSFFDRTAAEHQEASEDAWRRALGFIRTGDPASRA
jgi:carboxymethylenebutenolidase